MVFEFKLPDIGEGVHEGEIVSWLVKEGDEVQENQDICEVMTDKATVEISSPRTGTIQTIHFQEGDVVHVGDTFVTIAEAGDAATGPSTAETAEDAEGDDAAAEGQKEEKTLFDLPSELGSGPRARKPADGGERRAPVAKASGGPVLALPKTRVLARELGVDITRAAASGNQGQVTDADVRALAEGGAAAPAAGGLTFDLPAIPGEGVAERQRLSPLRRTIAKNLTRSKHLAPHFTYVVEIDAEKLVELRAEAKGLAEEQGVKLTYLPFLIKAYINAARKHPRVNAKIDENAQELVVFDSYSVGVAVATEHGLLVPVVKDCQDKSVVEIAREIEDLSERARAGKARPDDFQGGTFTITSLGRIGGLLATPIINHPEVAIMGVHALRAVPVVRDGEVVPGKVMNLSFSFDHRVIDGYDGALFAQDLVRYLEDPNLLLLEGL